jgi:hypothetical protein
VDVGEVALSASSFFLAPKAMWKPCIAWSKMSSSILKPGSVAANSRPKHKPNIVFFEIKFFHYGWEFAELLRVGLNAVT